MRFDYKRRDFLKLLGKLLPYQLVQKLSYSVLVSETFSSANSLAGTVCGPHTVDTTVFTVDSTLINVSNSSWTQDSDCDGLTNDDERTLYGTDPLNPDSDGDGFWDGDEVLASSNPLDPDDPIASAPVDFEGTIKTSDGVDICAMVLASGQFMFSCNPIGVFSLHGLPREQNGTVKRQIYADGFFPKIDVFSESSDETVIMTRSGTCPNYNVPYNAGFFPNSTGKRINIAGRVLVQNSQTPICAMVLANGQHMFSCDGSGSYALNIPLDTKGQYKLQVYADGFAPTIQTFDEFSPVNDVRMARAVECQ